MHGNLFLMLAVLERQKTVKGYSNSLDGNKLATLWKKIYEKPSYSLQNTTKKKLKTELAVNLGDN